MRKILIVLYGVAMGAVLSACADLPHLRILHDPLTPEEHVTLALTYEIQDTATSQPANIAQPWRRSRDTSPP